MKVRGRSGEGQARIRKVKVRLGPAQRTQRTRPEQYPIFGFYHPPPPHKRFSWLLRGLDMSDGWVGMTQVGSEEVRTSR